MTQCDPAGECHIRLRFRRVSTDQGRGTAEIRRFSFEERWKSCRARIFSLAPSTIWIHRTVTNTSLGGMGHVRRHAVEALGTVTNAITGINVTTA